MVEKLPFILLKGMLKFWNKTRKNEMPNIMMTLQGRFRVEPEDTWHLLHISDETQTTIPVYNWF